VLFCIWWTYSSVQVLIRCNSHAGYIHDDAWTTWCGPGGGGGLGPRLKSHQHAGRSPAAGLRYSLQRLEFSVDLVFSHDEAICHDHRQSMIADRKPQNTKSIAWLRAVVCLVGYESQRTETQLCVKLSSQRRDGRSAAVRRRPMSACGPCPACPDGSLARRKGALQRCMKISGNKKGGVHRTGNACACTGLLGRWRRLRRGGRRGAVSHYTSPLSALSLSSADRAPAAASLRPAPAPDPATE